MTDKLGASPTKNSSPARHNRPEPESRLSGDDGHEYDGVRTTNWKATAEGSRGAGKPRMLVIATCPFPANRGTPSRILRMAESLLEYYRIDVLTYPLADDVEVDSALSIRRVRNVLGYDKRSPGPSFTKAVLDLEMLPVVRDLARGNDYDIVYAHHVEGCAVGLLWKTLSRSNVPVVYDVHASLTDELEQFGFLYNRITRPLWAFLEDQLLARADRLVCVSEDLQSTVLDRGLAREEEVTVVPTGIQYDAFRAKIEDESPFDHPGPTVTYAGSMAPYQNLTELPAIVEEVNERCGPVEFCIVAGSVNETDFRTVVKAARDQGVADRLNVLTGVPFPEVPSYLYHSDVLINLRTECSGVPQKLVNYMAAGRPIVSAAGSAKPLEDENNAFVVEDHNTGDFADAVVELLSDSERGASLGRRAADDARRYDWERLAAHLWEFLE